MSDLLKHLDRIEALAAKASPGPWFAISDLPSYTVGNRAKDIIATRNSLYRAPHVGRQNYGCAENDAAFIAALDPETVQALVAVVRAAEENRRCVGMNHDGALFRALAALERAFGEQGR